MTGTSGAVAQPLPQPEGVGREALARLSKAIDALHEIIATDGKLYGISEAKRIAQEVIDEIDDCGDQRMYHHSEGGDL